MEKEVLKFIESNKMLQHGDSVVLGVSGGADSLCMLIMLHKLASRMDLHLIVVHINHNIRGEEADNDQRYVEEFCENMGVRCITYQIQVNELAEEMKCSKEEAGRIARYEIFNKVAAQYGDCKIAVAHNLNDNSETVLLNLFRGTGVKGLAGIMPKRENIIRPIMCLTRKQIEDYMNENKIPYCTDSTNLEDEYTRNKIRHNIIPVAESGINSATIQNIARTAGELMAVEEYLENQTDEAFSKIVTQRQNGFLVVQEEVHTVIRSRIIRRVIESLAGKLKDITRQHIESVLGLFEKNTGSHVDLPYGIMAEKSYEGVIIWQENTDNSDEKDVLDGEDEILLYIDGDIHCHKIMTIEAYNINEDKMFADGVSMEEFVKNLPQNEYTKWIDCDKIKDTLVLRHRQSGDYITINESGDRKKLKEYFINEKIPKEQREHIWLVADGQHIVWVVGHRMSSYYKLAKDTKKVLKLEYKKDNSI